MTGGEVANNILMGIITNIRFTIGQPLNSAKVIYKIDGILQLGQEKDEAFHYGKSPVGIHVNVPLDPPGRR